MAFPFAQQQPDFAGAAICRRAAHPAELGFPSTGQDAWGASARLFAAPILLIFDDRITLALRFSLKRTRRHGSSVIAANAFAV